MNSDPFETSNDLKFIIKNLYTRTTWFFKFTQENYYGKYAWHLLYIAALVSQLGRISSTKTTIESWSGLFFQIITLGSGLTVLFYIIGAYILSAVGKFFKGEAPAADTLRVISYSSLPAVFSLLFYVIGAILYGLPFFTNSFWQIDINPVQTIFKWLIRLVNALAGINMVVFLVVGIATVNNFSIPKAILTLLTPIFILVAIVFALLLF
ncbi:YIP1 family protein [Sphingobacterium sp. UGAL515B_05]|uniref:YIP1 family protein n=1 Tax=Sphingobacterium sp. UGAL515B_05 TaxID=2986767 RepID=UPI002954906A|nr:YIP1 family protein [Sphingobacterium sp. UGAL515B_05]WON92739.1 YIP1 family protein [Sphingobacterium sp. UGAL515B_05]